MKKISIIFSFNIQQKIWQQFKNIHFEKIQTYLKNNNFDSILLPVINVGNEGIEQRAKKINEQLQKLNREIQYHVIAYSVSGLDFRYLISHLSEDYNIKSLTTLATPNRGSRLASSYIKGHIQDTHIEPIMRLLGIDKQGFKELEQDNIQSFNQFTMNKKSVSYFSIGAEKNSVNSHEIFKTTNKFLFDNQYTYAQMVYEKAATRNIPLDNDGVFCHDEFQWGTHLTNFDADHAEIAGLGTFKHEKVLGLICQNIKSL